MKVLRLHLKTFQAIGFLSMPKSESKWNKTFIIIILYYIVISQGTALMSSSVAFFIHPALINKLTILFEIITSIRVLSIILTILTQEWKLQRLFDNFQKIIDECTFFAFFSL